MKRTYDSTGEVREMDWGQGPTMDMIFYYSKEETSWLDLHEGDDEAVSVMTAFLTRS